MSDSAKKLFGKPLTLKAAVSPQGQTGRFWLTHVGLPLALAAVMAFLYPHTPLDRWFTDWYFDPQAMRFPLKQDFWMSTVMHTGMKRLMSSFECIVMLATVASLLRQHWRPYALPLAWLTLALLAGPIAVAYLKHHSIHGCPWDLVEYGGRLPWLDLFAKLPPDTLAGHCFPGGHASGGFALFALYFVLRDRNRFWALFSLGMALTLGMAMGWAQIERGAHFLSHNIWSGLIVWGVCLLFYLAMPLHRQAPAGGASKFRLGEAWRCNQAPVVALPERQRTPSETGRL